MNKKTFLPVITVIGLFFTCGCNAPREQLLEFNKSFEVSDFNTASVFAEKNIKSKKDPSCDDLLWTLQAGAARRALKDYAFSTKHFDICNKIRSCERHTVDA